MNWFDPVGEPHRFFKTEGPLGPLLVTYSSVGVSGVWLVESSLTRSLDTTDAQWKPVKESDFCRVAQRFLGRRVEPGSYVDRAFHAGVEAALAGRGSVLIDMTCVSLGPRSRAALEATTQIEVSRLSTYGQLGKWVRENQFGETGIDAKDQGQWVGEAMKQNPAPFLIPCHRIIDVASMRRVDQLWRARRPLNLPEYGRWGYGRQLKKVLLDMELGSV